MSRVPEHILDWRRKTGLDRRDEVWEGVLHMSPEADREHQDLEGSLEAWLRRHWARPRRSKVYHRINVSTSAADGDWTDNYRIPDLVLLAADRFSIDRRTYFAGGPQVVVEIRSPDDESEDKLPFYASIDVLEVWIIDRDTKEIALHLLEQGTYRRQPVDADGWTRSPFAGVEFRVGRPGKLRVRLNGKPETEADLPED